MFSKEKVTCPVCKAVLGYITKNEVCSFVCQECQWIFSWLGKNKMGIPVKVNPKKRDVCDCSSCKLRDEIDRGKK